MPFSARQLRNLKSRNHWRIRHDGFDFQLENRPDGLTWKPAWPVAIERRERALELMIWGMRNCKWILPERQAYEDKKKKNIPKKK